MNSTKWIRGAELSIATWLCLVGVATLCTTLYGVVHYFSPIPYYDQWNGGLGFLREISSGESSAWWKQHMEHRIVISRVLFWLDANLFGGRNVFLLAVGLIIQSLTALLFIRQFRKNRSTVPVLAAIGITLTFLFSWTQQENLSWGFQSQFFAVYLFALVSFAVLATGAPGSHSRCMAISGALLAAVLSTLSMANGLCVFAILCFQMLLLRRPRELVYPLIVGGIVAASYIHGSIKADTGFPDIPFHVAVHRVPDFFLAFMGTVVFTMTREILATVIFGLASVLTMAYLTIRLWRARAVTPYRSFLIAGYAFIALSGAGAAHGRYMMGMDQAVVSRYHTPMLISLTCLMLLLLDVTKSPRIRLAVLVALACFTTWILPYQKLTWHETQMPFERNLAVLSVKLGIKRPDVAGSVYYPRGWDYLASEANYAADREFGPYASGWLHSVGVLNFSPDRVDNSLCDGHLDVMTTDSVGPAAAGWVITKRIQTGPTLIVLVDAENKTVGYGISGALRPDVKRVTGKGLNSGWTSYAYAGTKPIAAYAYEMRKFCRLASD